MVLLLLDHGADASVKDADGTDAVWRASGARLRCARARTCKRASERASTCVRARAHGRSGGPASLILSTALAYIVMAYIVMAYIAMASVKDVRWHRCRVAHFRCAA